MPETNEGLAERLHQVRQRIAQAEADYGRAAGSVELLAVSKTRPLGDIVAAMALGQQRFGESYLQEALAKIEALPGPAPEWHFIGHIQGNKTQAIARHFDWVHSLASLKHARRLSAQRPTDLPPLNVCIQVNTSGEASKGGHGPEELPSLLPEYAGLPGLRIQGLMTLPAPATGLAAQRQPFRLLRELRDRLRSEALPLKVLSMGMSDDLEAAIAEGATLVRIGTAIFGPRQYNR